MSDHDHIVNDVYQKADRIAELEAQVARLQRGIEEIVSAVIPATGVSVTSESARAAREGILAYSGIDPNDLDPTGGGDARTT